MYTIERVHLDAVTIAELDDLEHQCFPEDGPHPKGGHRQAWWVAREKSSGVVVGYAGSVHVTLGAAYFSPGRDRCLFLARAGVLPRARGHGLQRRLIRARLSHARRLKCRGAYTYTTIENVASANNLIECGFRLWVPDVEMVRGKVYWWRDV